jgi:tetratricopeptide (TPR) repeat protein
MAFNLGELSEKHNDLNSAISHYSNALSYDNTFSKAYFNRAKCFTKLQQFDKAIVDYKNFIQFISETDNKSLSALHYEIAQLYGEKGDFKNALTSVTKSLQNNSSNVSALELRGTIYAQLGDIQNAIADYLEVEKLDNAYFNNSPNILMNLPLLDEGMALESKIILTERAVILNPNYDIGYYNLGIFYKKSKQLDKAIEAFRIAHEKKPKSLDNLRELCQCFADTQDYNNLKVYLEKLVALGDQNAKQNLDNLNEYFKQINKTPN